MLKRKKTRKRDDLCWMHLLKWKDVKSWDPSSPSLTTPSQSWSSVWEKEWELSLRGDISPLTNWRTDVHPFPSKHRRDAQLLRRKEEWIRVTPMMLVALLHDAKRTRRCYTSHQGNRWSNATGETVNLRCCNSVKEEKNAAWPVPACAADCHYTSWSRRLRVNSNLNGLSIIRGNGFSMKHVEATTDLPVLVGIVWWSDPSKTPPRQWDLLAYGPHLGTHKLSPYFLQHTHVIGSPNEPWITTIHQAGSQPRRGPFF